MTHTSKAASAACSAARAAASTAARFAAQSVKKRGFRETTPGASDGGKLEYDLAVGPGADAGRIEIAYEGVDSIRVDPGGDLILRTAGGELRQQRPKVYQEVDGSRIAVEAKYRLKGRRTVAFELASFDARKELVIDPVLVYSTYLGGSGDEIGGAIAVDGSGNVYLTGNTSSTNFPAGGALQGTLGGQRDAFVTKINAAGTAAAG